MTVGVKGALVEETADGFVGVFDDELFVKGWCVRIEVVVDVARGSEGFPEDDLVWVGEMAFKEYRKKMFLSDRLM